MQKIIQAQATTKKRVFPVMFRLTLSTIMGIQMHLIMKIDLQLMSNSRISCCQLKREKDLWFR